MSISGLTHTEQELYIERVKGIAIISTLLKEEIISKNTFDDLMYIIRVLGTKWYDILYEKATEDESILPATIEYGYSGADKGEYYIQIKKTKR